MYKWLRNDHGHGRLKPIGAGMECTKCEWYFAKRTGQCSEWEDPHYMQNHWDLPEWKMTVPHWQQCQQAQLMLFQDGRE